MIFGFKIDLRLKCKAHGAAPTDLPLNAFVDQSREKTEAHMISGFKVDLRLKMQGAIIERLLWISPEKTEANMISYLNVDLRLKCKAHGAAPTDLPLNAFVDQSRGKTEAHISGFNIS